MSYIREVDLYDYNSGWVNRGQYIELGNLRLWMSASGGTGPQLSTVSGSSGAWFTARRFYYPANTDSYTNYILPLTTSPTSFVFSNYQTIGDSEEIHFVEGGYSWRAMFNVGNSYNGVFLSLEKLSVNRLAGTIGPEKTSGVVANGVDLVVGNLKFSVGSTNMLRVSHVSNAVQLVGQTWIGYNGGQQTAQTVLTTTASPQYLGNPGWALSGPSQIASTLICELMHVQDNVRYRVTQVLFSSNFNVTLNLHYITVEKF